MGRRNKTDNLEFNDRREVAAGISLVEVLVGLAIASIIVFALYNLFGHQQNAYSVQDDVSEMQQNLRVSLERISGDLMMAGFGKTQSSAINGEDLSSWYTAENGWRPVSFSHNAAPYLDRLEIVGCLTPADGHVAAVSGNTITLQEPASVVSKLFNTGSRSDINIGGVFDAKVTAIDADSPILTLSVTPPAFSAGTQVYVLRHFTYQISATKPNILVLDEHRGSGAQELCVNLKGFDVTFATNNGMTNATIQLTGETQRPDPTTRLKIAETVNSTLTLRNP
jgi:Tfp pilus assembly protein PilW